MRKFKNWLIKHFLPNWAKETVLSENMKLQEQVEKLKQEKASLVAYIDGLETGIKAQRRIIINAGEVRK